MSALDELTRLTELRERGALTDDQFEHEKRRLGIGLSDPRRVQAARAARRQKRYSSLINLLIIFVVVVALLFLSNMISASPDNGASDQNSRDAGNVTTASMLVDEYRRAEKEATRESAAALFAEREPPTADVAVYSSGAEAKYAERDFSSYEKRLIDQARKAWDDYRGGDDDRGKAYDDHSMLLAKLFGRGICWGRDQQYQAEYDYHRCIPDSLQMQPTEPIDAR